MPNKIDSPYTVEMKSAANEFLRQQVGKDVANNKFLVDWNRYILFVKDEGIGLNTSKRPVPLDAGVSPGESKGQRNYNERRATITSFQQSTAGKMEATQQALTKIAAYIQQQLPSLSAATVEEEMVLYGQGNMEWVTLGLTDSANKLWGAGGNSSVMIAPQESNITLEADGGALVARYKVANFTIAQSSGDREKHSVNTPIPGSIEFYTAPDAKSSPLKLHVQDPIYYSNALLKAMHADGYFPPPYRLNAVIAVAQAEELVWKQLRSSSFSEADQTTIKTCLTRLATWAVKGQPLDQNIIKVLNEVAGQDSDFAELVNNFLQTASSKILTPLFPEGSTLSPQQRILNDAEQAVLLAIAQNVQGPNQIALLEDIREIALAAKKMSPYSDVVLSDRLQAAAETNPVLKKALRTFATTVKMTVAEYAVVNGQYNSDIRDAVVQVSSGLIQGLPISQTALANIAIAILEEDQNLSPENYDTTTPTALQNFMLTALQTVYGDQPHLGLEKLPHFVMLMQAEARVLDAIPEKQIPEAIAFKKDIRHIVLAIMKDAPVDQVVFDRVKNSSFSQKNEESQTALAQLIKVVSEQEPAFVSKRSPLIFMAVGMLGLSVGGGFLLAQQQIFAGSGVVKFDQIAAGSAATFVAGVGLVMLALAVVGMQNYKKGLKEFQQSQEVEHLPLSMTKS